MLKLLKSSILGLIFFISSNIHAIDLSDIEPWSKDKSYDRGDIVKLSSVAYIAVLPSRSLDPTSHKIAWRVVNLNSKEQAKLRNIYLIGKVINFEGVKYVSLKINIIQNVSDLLDDRKWLEISDRTNGYDLPIYDEDEAMATLIGVDNNENGIRDDYETKIVLSELPQAVKDRALAAGKVYTSAMQIGSSKETVSIAMARLTMQNLIHAHRCKINSAPENSGRGWKESDFYNTVDRIEAKFLIQSNLVDVAGRDTKYDFPEDPCAAISIN